MLILNHTLARNPVQSPGLYRLCKVKKELTYCNHPAADVLIEDNFGPQHDEHTAIPERLGLERTHKT